MAEDRRSLFKEVSALARKAQETEALRLLRDAISRRQLDAEGMDKAGRRCKALFGGQADVGALRVLLLGQCTTTWLANAVTAAGWGDGRALDVVEGAHDNVLQELLSTPDTARFDVVVLLPWHQRLLSDGTDRSGAERIAAEVAFWWQAWRLIDGKHSARIVQVGYDWVTPGALGYGIGARAEGPVALVRGVNRELQATLPQGGVFIDLEQISGDLGRQRFYDPRRYHWTKQPFSEDGVVRLAEHIAAGIRALTTGPRKVLVLDLDNTVWGGVVGEKGPLGITLGDSPDGEAFRAFQQHVKCLSDRGVVLAVCSKNNDADARGPFEANPHMLLSLDDFAQFEASWDPKAVALRRIAKNLKLGLDSFAFFDDNPAEREHVRQALPEVAVVEVPEDPAEFTRALDAALWFEAVDLTDADRRRAEQYRSEQRRRAAEGTYDSLDTYLTSLGMAADVCRIDEADMDRVVQLIGKTNQFNLTTRRHGLAQVRQLLAVPGTIALSLRLADRFGDYGLVSVLLAVGDPAVDAKTLHIDTWLMSCRVIGRTVEEFFFGTLVETARRAGIERLVGLYVPTAKNALVKDLYQRLGFELRGTSDAGTEYQLDLSRAVQVKHFVQPAPQDDLLVEATGT